MDAYFSVVSFLAQPCNHFRNAAFACAIVKNPGDQPKARREQTWSRVTSDGFLADFLNTQRTQKRNPKFCYRWESTLVLVRAQLRPVAASMRR